MIRFLDVCLATIGLLVALPLLVTIALVGLFDTGSPLFLQQRVGRFQKPFTLIKVRTMKKGTESVATHLARSTDITPFGRFLRQTKLDELPQLWNVLVGQMSLVGPRPCLPGQRRLILERDSRGVFDSRPGITGLAQVKHIDMSTPVLLSETDQEMLRQLNLRTYFKYLFLTLIGNGRGDRVIH